MTSDLQYLERLLACYCPNTWKRKIIAFQDSATAFQDHFPIDISIHINATIESKGQY